MITGDAPLNDSEMIKRFLNDSEMIKNEYAMVFNDYVASMFDCFPINVSEHAILHCSFHVLVSLSLLTEMLLRCTAVTQDSEYCISTNKAINHLLFVA